MRSDPPKCVGHAGTEVPPRPRQTDGGTRAAEPFASPPELNFFADAARSVAYDAEPEDAEDRVYVPGLKRRRTARIVIGLCVVSAAVACTVWWLHRPRFEPHVRLDESGRQVLTVECASCLNGTKLSIGDQVSEFRSGMTSITFAKPFPVGNTTVTPSVHLPNGEFAGRVPLILSIPFRIQPDLAALGRPVPTLRWTVQAERGYSLFIDQRSVPINGQGNGAYEICLPADSSPSSEQRPMQRTLHYALVHDGRLVEDGNLSITVRVAPLEVALSPDPAQRQRVLVKGRSAEGATIEINGAAISLTEGAFEESVAVAGLAEVVVVARVPGCIARTVHLPVSPKSIEHSETGEPKGTPRSLQ